jgi:lipoate-protein ligase A
MVAGAKVVGSAQRRKAGALVQHGSILLATSPFAKWLKGIRELAGVTVDPVELARNLALEIPRALADQGIPIREKAMGWTDSERDSAATIATSRYENPEWTNRR